MVDRMKSKMVVKLALYFAAALLVFTVVLGAVFMGLFRQHTINMNQTDMEAKAVSIANRLAAFSMAGVELASEEAVGELSGAGDSCTEPAPGESATAPPASTPTPPASSSAAGVGEGQGGGQGQGKGKGQGKGQGQAVASVMTQASAGKETGSQAVEATPNPQTQAPAQGEGQGQGKGKGKGGYGAYLRFLRELAMAEVWVVDENMKLLTTQHAMREMTYSQLPKNAEEIVARVFDGEITHGKEFSNLLDTPSITVGVPIRVENGVVVGAVLLHSPVSGIEAAVREGLSALAAGLGIALLIAGIAGVLLAVRFTRPLERMRVTAQSLAQGDYQAKTGVTLRDEMGQLAQTIDGLSVQLQEARDKREELNRMKESFVSNVSHELRTPVAVMRGSLEVLRDGTISDPTEIVAYYEQMLGESRHLERLVNDLLDLSRLQDSGFQLKLEEVNLCDVVRDAARAIGPKAREKGLTVTARCPDWECLVEGDYGRLRQMLMILLDNGVKFSKLESELVLSLEREKAFLLTVTDQGIPIPQEDLPHVFERFHKLNGPENKTGTGLGLPIAKEIAQRHHAELWAESDQESTRFSILFGEQQGE